MEDNFLIFKSGIHSESSLKNKWIKIIQDEGIIKRTDLMRGLGITLRTYQNYSGIIQEEFEEFVEYNRVSKRWMWIKKEETEQVEEVSNA